MPLTLPFNLQLECRICGVSSAAVRQVPVDEVRIIYPSGDPSALLYSPCTDSTCRYVCNESVHDLFCGSDSDSDDDSYSYVSETEDGDDPLEYDSEYESENEFENESEHESDYDSDYDSESDDDQDEETAQGEQEILEDNEDDENSSMIYRAWLNSVSDTETAPREVCAILPGIAAGLSVCPHVAGPDCTRNDGYSGKRISAEEAMGCSTLQALVRKKRPWQPDVHDEDFELRTDYVLTGLRNMADPYSDSCSYILPTRLRPAQFNAAPVDYPIPESEDLRDTDIPFHPTCFEVYRHASRQQFGSINIEGFVQWRNLEVSEKAFLGFPFDFAVHRARTHDFKQPWRHEAGSEWLIANPVCVPALIPILQSVISSEPLDPSGGVFAPRDHVSSEAPCHDPFIKLPRELKDKIYVELSSRDIANLRVVSRAFAQLPLWLFENLVRDEMPWLWEVWSDHPPSRWVSEEARDRADYELDIQVFRDAIKGGMPRLLNRWKAAEPTYMSKTPPEKMLPKTKLPPKHTDWYKLYRDITVNWEDLKGLRNRRRIWKDVQEIIRRIKQYQAEGKID